MKPISHILLPVFVLTVVLAVGVLAARAQVPTSDIPASAQGTEFTYKGQLSSNGSPANGSFDFQFKLYDAAAGGLQVGSTQSVAGAVASQGFFTVLLDFGSVFDGAARWLEIAVRPAGGGAYTTLSPRQALSAVPYALSLAPGAIVQDGTAVNIFKAVNTLSGGIGIHAEANGGISSAGIYAKNITGNAIRAENVDGIAVSVTSTNGPGIMSLSGGDRAIWGQTNSSVNDTAAIYGNAYATTGDTRGVHGINFSDAGIGVLGEATSQTGMTFGVAGAISSPGGSAVVGHAQNTTGLTFGVSGYSNSNAGTGIYGYASHVTGITKGVWGEAVSPGGIGVYGNVSGISSVGVWGYSSSSSGSTVGVMGASDSPDGTGVEGRTSSGNGATVGVRGGSHSTSGYGIVGIAHSQFGTNYGVAGQSLSTSGVGVSGYASANSGTTYGVRGQSDSPGGFGVVGSATTTTGSTYGVAGQSASTNGVGTSGFASATSGVNVGVRGQSNSPSGYAVYGYNNMGGFAGGFQGNVAVYGTLSKSAGSFQIDHPLDPANQYLYHSFVESPDMKNIYDGVVMLDQNGEATVTMPDWFQALNGDAAYQGDYRYQLTPVGAAMPNLFIAQKITGNTFKIAGGAPGMEVSWQVTGIRHDPYAEANRIPVEAPKPGNEQGTYLFPQLYGQPASLGVNYSLLQAQPAAPDTLDIDLRLPH